jgi:hypothetical protein
MPEFHLPSPPARRILLIAVAAVTAVAAATSGGDDAAGDDGTSLTSTVRGRDGGSATGSSENGERGADGRSGSVVRSDGGTVVLRRDGGSITTSDDGTSTYSDSRSGGNRITFSSG